MARDHSRANEQPIRVIHSGGIINGRDPSGVTREVIAEKGTRGPVSKILRGPESLT